MGTCWLGAYFSSTHLVFTGIARLDILGISDRALLLSNNGSMFLEHITDTSHKDKLMKVSNT